MILFTIEIENAFNISPSKCYECLRKKKEETTHKINAHF